MSIWQLFEYLGRGQAIRIAVRQTYMINPKKQKVTVKNLRQILSHIIQWIESKAVYETILNNPEVCSSIEHGGFVSYKPVKGKLKSSVSEDCVEEF